MLLLLKTTLRLLMNLKRLASASPATCLVAGAFLIACTVAGCDFLDPTEVENPRATEEELLANDNPTAALLPGLRAQFARALNAVVVTVAFGSDSYSINGTGVGGSDLDFPRDITPQTNAVSSTGTLGAYWNLQELRAFADYLLNEIAPVDENATDDLLAEAHYYRGMAFLMQGENFVALPTEEDGEPLPAAGLLERALADFSRATELGLPEDLNLRTVAALARTHRALGNRAKTVQFANDALAEGGDGFLEVQEYDKVLLDTDIGNEMQDFLIDRSIQEAQPLPRLDFLDPKYLRDESAIPVAKAEEMYLLLAEAALADGDLASARDLMIDVIELAETRPVVPFDDSDERLDNDLNPRPRSAEIVVRADADSPFEADLVFTRPGEIATPTISGTSVTADEVNAAADQTSLLRLLYRLRQEILFLEGRRLHDLGIRLPMMEREIDTNPNVEPGDFGTTVFVPDYVPPANEIDLYTPLELYDEDGNLLTTEVTILHDMNRILATERGTVLEAPLLPTP